MQKKCQTLQQEALELNKQFREKNQLKQKYEYGHFYTEGFVLYLLDKDGFVINRVMYKIKPRDIEVWYERKINFH